MVHIAFVERKRRECEVASHEEILTELANTIPQVASWTQPGRDSMTLLMWKLIPVGVEASETMGRGSPPLYEGDATGQSSARTQHTESERDEFGTIVTEVTTVTTRRRYRVENT